MTGTSTRQSDLTALVLAAGRHGVQDSVAQLQNKSHKCFVMIDGEVMLERVVKALRDSGGFGRIFISIEREDDLRQTESLSRWLDDGTISWVKSGLTLADSLFAAGKHIPDAIPLVVTTGDNVLHTAPMIADFNRQFLAGHCDLAIAFTSEDVVAPVHPDSGLNWHRLKDGNWSACNIYGLRSADALKAVEVFRGGGQFGKRHWRILKAFGIVPFILYKLRLTALDPLIQRVARNIGITAQAIDLPYADGPIDVDNPTSFALSERVLKERRAAAITQG